MRLSGLCQFSNAHLVSAIPLVLEHHWACCWAQRALFTVCWNGRTMAYRGLLALVSRLTFCRRLSRESTRHPASTRCSASLVTSFCCKGIIANLVLSSNIRISLIIIVNNISLSNCQVGIFFGLNVLVDLRKSLLSVVIVFVKFQLLFDNCCIYLLVKLFFSVLLFNALPFYGE